MPKNKILIVSNWKMHPNTVLEASELLSKLNFTNTKNKEFVICPPAPFIPIVANYYKKNKNVKIGAQNISEYESGAYTGEFSAKQVVSLGVNYVILGHSERRKVGETDESVSEKIKLAFKNKLTPIVCIGESVRDERGEYHNFIQQQLLNTLGNITKVNVSKVIIAYEPIWAIGENAKRETTKEEVLEMNIFIKKVLTDKFGEKTANQIRIIYGGSVNEKNFKQYIDYGRANGLLVGSASLDYKKFNIICQK